MKKGFLTDATEESLDLWLTVMDNKNLTDEKLGALIKKKLGFDEK